MEMATPQCGHDRNPMVSVFIRVVAEGIETEGERGIMRALGCSVGQGYLFAAPMDASDFNRFLGDGLILREGWNAQRLLTMLDGADT